MPDDVADQLAHQQLGGGYEITESPCVQLFAYVLASLSGCPGIVREGEGGDVEGSGAPGTDDEQGGVVRRLLVVGQQSRHDPAAQLLQAPDAVLLIGGPEGGRIHHGSGEGLAQLSQSLVGVPGGGFDEPVGVQDEKAVVGQVQLMGLEGRPGGSQRGSGATSGASTVPSRWTTRGGG